jgi:flavin reductase (DIM6/NTAB) family NADH-FMN oxidoreductase RutF
MIPRRTVSVLHCLLALPIILSLAGCASLVSISINPPAGTVTLTAVGQTAQYTALGENQMGSANPTTSNITGSVTWSVSNPNVATISTTGLATAVGAGYTQVMAESGGITATSDMTVTIPGSTSGTTGSTIVSLAIIPGSQSVASPTQTTQFLAIGTTSSATTVNLTGQVAWSSSSTQIATIGVATGLATAVGQGSTTITAIYTNSTGGTVVAGTATFTVTGGTTEKYTAVAITPGTQGLSASGQTGQFIALGTSGTTGLETDVTNSAQIKWSSSIPSIASVSATGLATGLSVGTTTITAELTNADGSVVSNTASVAVSATAAPEPLLSLTIVPASITVGNLQDTGQFLAIGTFSTVPYVRDLTNSPTMNWISSEPSVFTVNTNSSGSPGASAGTVTAYGNGSAVIIAEASSSDGTIQTATATFNCPLALPNPLGNPPTPGTCNPGSQAPSLLATLTVYNEGLNTTNWLVTAASATGTPNVLHCGPGSASGGSVCVATYPVGTTPVILTAPANGAAFGGWSYNCTPSNASGVALPGPVFWTAAGPNYCTVTLTTNDTVGAIFN